MLVCNVVVGSDHITVQQHCVRPWPCWHCLHAVVSVGSVVCWICRAVHQQLTRMTEHSEKMRADVLHFWTALDSRHCKEALFLRSTEQRVTST